MRNFYFVVLIFAFVACNSDKTGYVNLIEIYSKIDLSSKYQKQIESYENKLQRELIEAKSKNDSIKSLINLDKASQAQLKLIYTNKIKLDSLELKLNKKLKDSTLILNKDIEEKVNQWVYEYGKINGYQYIFSPLNTNTFMYADSVLDITQPVVDFINAKK